MKTLKYMMIAGVMFVAHACTEFDPTADVENPNLLLSNVIGSPGSTTSWINGQERQMAIVYNQLLELTEIGSDNYVNTQTFFNQRFDRLDITFQETAINTLQFRIADLRQSATTGLNDVQPNDPDGTEEQRAELLFYQGWAKLLAGELFVALPMTPEGEPMSPEQNINSAISDFEAAETIDGTNVSYKLALARAHYYLGNQAEAVAKANEVLTLDASYTRRIEFDGPNGPDSDFADALFQRGNFDDLQPLPRLDFLDPKYRVEGDEESPVYIQKAEEAHLILAEAALADNDLPAAQTQMTNLLTLVGTRQVDTFDDAVENRENRPSAVTDQVRASASDPFIANLVLSRSSGDVSIPVISGTSVAQAQIDGLADVVGALETLYLMRQEIFIAEGRRFVDLGIKMPVSENEQLINASVTDAHITPFIPAFVPTNMDEFTYDEATGEATIAVNMNNVLVANRTDASVIPFF